MIIINNIWGVMQRSFVGGLVVQYDIFPILGIMT